MPGRLKHRPGALAGKKRRRAATAAAAKRPADDEASDGEEVVQEGVVESAEHAAIAERLRAEALRESGREARKLATRLELPEADDVLLLPAPRGCVTSVCLSQDGEFVWCGDKGGRVWRACLQSAGSADDWTLMGRHDGKVLCLAVSDTTVSSGIGAAGGGDRSSSNLIRAKYPSLVASGGTDNMIKVFDGRDGTIVTELKGHRKPVTALCFRFGTNTLYSGAYDRTLKAWAVEDSVCLDTLYGPTAPVTSLSALWKDQAVVASEDSGCRLFKVEKGTCSAFEEQSMPVEACAMLDDSTFLTAGADGSVWVHNVQKRKPIAMRAEAHGSGFKGDGDGLEQDFGRDQLNAIAGRHDQPERSNWILSAAAVPYADIAATGGVGGEIKLWHVAQDEGGGGGFVPGSGIRHTLRELAVVPLRGVVTSLHFSRSGDMLAAAVSREPRLGRWFTDREAPNLVAVFPLRYAEAASPAAPPRMETLSRRAEAVGVGQMAAAATRPQKKRRRLVL
eukprot:Hpha_TRINITY_DN31464_c0_g1::TRINITY_DN31464_c0_g1_i1::g.145322::m.145322/K14793/RRP9; ribosomal RNA-processing protein 9